MFEPEQVTVAFSQRIDSPIHSGYIHDAFSDQKSSCLEICRLPHLPTPEQISIARAEHIDGVARTIILHKELASRGGEQADRLLRSIVPEQFSIIVQRLDRTIIGTNIESMLIEQQAAPDRIAQREAPQQLAILRSPRVKRSILRNEIGHITRNGKREAHR